MNDIATIETQLAGTEIATLLPPDISPDKFRSVALAAIRNNPELLKCDPRSLFNACMDAAQDGLLPDGREGAIVPRKGKAVWQSMIRGIYKRIKSGGSVSALSVNVVYEGEEFAVLLGDEDRIVHRRDLSKVAPGQEVAVYAIATLKDGCKEREVMTWDQVEQVRRSSSMPNSGPWTQWGDEMARKTVVRRLAKRLPVIEPADEAVHRTIERVDSLYDFGAKPADAPTVEHEANAANTYPQQVGQSALNQSGLQVGQQSMKAAAASTPRTGRIVDKSQDYSDSVDSGSEHAAAPGGNGNGKPRQRGYREILESIRLALRDAQSREQVDRVFDSDDFRHGKEVFKGEGLEELNRLEHAAIKRWWHEPPADEDEGMELPDIPSTPR